MAQHRVDDYVVDSDEDDMELQPSGSFSSPTNASAHPGIINKDSKDGAAPKKRKKKTKRVLNCSLSKYPVIRDVAHDLGFIIDMNDEEVEKFEFNLLWTDTTLPLNKLVRLSNWQRTNHFPSMHLITRKVHLGLTLGKLRKVFPTHYSFFPRTWSLRSERSQFSKYITSLASKKTFILKPNAGCQGRGIVLSKDPLTAVEELDNYIVQEYITKPLLIEEKKFDMRVYVLVTSVRHLSIQVYKEGLVRMCAEPYCKPSDENIGTACMHLTNYAVNKHNENFVFNSDGERGDVGNKRDFIFLNRWLSENGHSPDKLWERVDHLVVKTIIAAQPQLEHVYNSCFPHKNDGFSCFEVLGFDILVDEKLKPWLMEVNHTPSLSCDTPLDRRIKHTLLCDVWNIINIQPTDKLKHVEREKMQFARRMNSVKNMGSAGAPQVEEPPPPEPFDYAEFIRQEDFRSKNFRRAYPPSSPERAALYQEMLQAATDASAAPTTASVEQRRAENERDRDLRQQQQQQRGAPPPREVKRMKPQQPGSDYSTTPPSSLVDSLPCLEDERRLPFPLMEPIPAPVVNLGSNVATKKPKPPKDPERERIQHERLRDQMEKHKRRMMLGPRLSVFQLRDSQIELAGEILPLSSNPLLLRRTSSEFDTNHAFWMGVEDELAQFDSLDI